MCYFSPIEKIISSVGATHAVAEYCMPGSYKHTKTPSCIFPIFKDKMGEKNPLLPQAGLGRL
jgi:hypothetical protein